MLLLRLRRQRGGVAAALPDMPRVPTLMQTPMPDESTPTRLRRGRAGVCRGDLGSGVNDLGSTGDLYL